MGLHITGANLIPFIKVYDAGRDFVVIRETRQGISWGQVARKICRRRDGVGAVGMIVSSNESYGNFRLAPFGADGAVMPLREDALRCAARALHADYGTKRMTLGVAGRRYRTRVDGAGTAVAVHHQQVPFGPFPLSVPGRDLDVYALYAHAEHLVSFVDDVQVSGGVYEAIARSGRGGHLPMRPFVSLVEVVDAATLKIRTFEHGIEVSSCCSGSGAVAAVAVGRHLGHVAKMEIEILTPSSSSFLVYQDEEAAAGEKWLRGDTEIICSGEFPWQSKPVHPAGVNGAARRQPAAVDWPQSSIAEGAVVIANN